MERHCSGEDSGFAVTVGCAVGETKIIRKMLESRFGRRGVILAITVKDVLEIAQTGTDREYESGSGRERS